MDQGQTAGQPQVRHQLQLVTDMQHVVRTQVFVVAHQGARWIGGAVDVDWQRCGFLGFAARQVGGAAQSEGGHAVQAEQAVPAGVVQGATDIAVVHADSIGAAAVSGLGDIHRVMVVGQAGDQGGVVVVLPGGLVCQPGAAGLVAVGVDKQVIGCGLTRIVLELSLCQAARRFVRGLAVTQVETRLQVLIEAIAEVAGDAFALA